jgi:hypothetical protein
MMSGGHFEYAQYKIFEIIDSIERILNKQGKERDKDELWYSDEHYEKYPEDRYFETYPKEIAEKFEDGLKALKIAHVYAQRIDWYLSGDDGEESFLKRLEEELKNLE